MESIPPLPWLSSSAALASLLAVALAAAGQDARTWTSEDGRTLEATLLRVDEEEVTLRLEDGREARVELARLSPADQGYARGQGGALARSRAAAAGGMPPDSSIPRELEVEGGPRVFHTRHFQFETDQGVTRGFIAEAARVFEGTLAAVEALPLGLAPRPPEGMERYRTVFLGREAFDRELRGLAGGTGLTGPASNVAGLYSPARKEALVPFTSIGARDLGSQKTLRRRSDTSTLVHEVVHQVMHDWLPLTPLWFSEGLAEYLAMVPSQNGRFEFRHAARGLKETLAERYHLEGGSPVAMAHPADLLHMASDAWRGQMDDYRSSLLLVYYFMHLDQPGRPGAPLADYLALLEEGKSGVERYIAEYNRLSREFEEKRVAYNAEVAAYNASLLAFRGEVDAYNERAAAYNQRVRAGENGENLPQPGAAPEPPRAPAPPEVPALLRENPGGGVIDVVAAMQDNARPVLYRGREPEELASAMREAYAAMGITLRLLEAGAVYPPRPGPAIRILPTP